MNLQPKYKKNFLSIGLIIAIVLQVTLITITSTKAIADDDLSKELEPEIYTDPYIRKMIIFKSGKMTPQFDYHLYTMHLSEGKSYTFYLKIYNKIGGEYIFNVSDQSQSIHELVEWDETTGFFEKKIKLVLEPNHNGDYSIEISYQNILQDKNSHYTLYANEQGFVGWWWLGLIGLLILAVFLFLVIGVPLLVRSKKKKTTKGTKKSAKQKKSAKKKS